MRRPYLDTSLLVAALVHEAGTATALRILQAHARQRFGVLGEQRLHSLPLAAEDFEVAARLFLVQASPLRAGDAPHLAVCQRLKLQLASFDRRLCKAAAHHQVAHEQLLI